MRLYAVLAIVASGCYAPAPADGVQGCAAGDACPDGYQCLADDKCHLAGTMLPGCVPACAGATPMCDLADPAHPVCVACLGDGDCGVGLLCVKKACMPGCSAGHSACGADAGSCDVDMHICRGCFGDVDCGGATPHCDVPSGSCQPCLPTADTCAKGKYCGGVPGRYACLAGCKSDFDCRASDDGGVGGDGGPGDGGQPASQVYCCAHVCVDTSGDGANCGQCGKACGQGGTCCGGACTDSTKDVGNCGGCGMVCAPANVMGPSCGASACGYGACTTGYADCDAKAANGCEVNTGTDLANCGGCGKACLLVANGTPGCAMGGCVITGCAAPAADCDGKYGNGCETNLQTDGLNCGKCGRPCALPNTSPSCVAGACTASRCLAGFVDCDGKPADGCEINILTDAKNCNGCGNMCANGLGCVNGVCGTPLHAPGTFGPFHTFAGMSTDHFITQGACSPSGGNIAADAAYFCSHFYGPNCSVNGGFVPNTLPAANNPKMHKMGGCTNLGNDIAGTMCEGGACKIGNWSEVTNGLANLVCVCK